ncbi:hypothetical protein CL617_03230 [archaeon]|nr:hypothetical protein [archaeon]|tara:strand:+ start:2135 stop:2587 length:453 start_codon:yes stop_codon:yes gene_type:complete
MESNYKIHEVMTHNVTSIDLNSTILEISKNMAEKAIGSVLIIQNEKPVGIITEQDVVRKVVASGKDAKTIRAKDIMSKNLISINSQEDLYQAVVAMSNSSIKHLPVIDNNKLVGIITSKDIVRLEPHLIEMLTFKSSLSNEEAKKLFDKL